MYWLFVTLLIFILIPLIWITILMGRKWDSNTKGHEMQQILTRIPKNEKVSEVRLTSVIVEFRKHQNLVPVIRNMWSKYPHMLVQVVCGLDNYHLLRELPQERLRVFVFPLHNITITDYNYLLTSYHFWNMLEGEHILVFQTDSVLFSRSTVDIDYYLKYDYVGAPWDVWIHVAYPRIKNIGNGGLSLRRRQVMLEIVQRFPFKASWYAVEDLYFAKCIHDGGYTYAPYEEAIRFSFETYSGKDLPLGAHKYLPPHDDITAEERNIIENY